VTVYVVQDQTELREQIAAHLVELLGPDVFTFAAPWELETFLNENPPQSSDVVVADLVSPDYWNSSPKDPLRRRSRPHSTEPEQAQLALVDAALDRIENYLKPL
jgi:FixJ family two-component response regulator